MDFSMTPVDDELIEVLPHSLEAAFRVQLAQSEKILLKLKGEFKEGLICTDHRVIIVKSGFMTGQMFGSNIFQLPYSSVGTVEVKTGMMTGGVFEISAVGMQNKRISHNDAAKEPNCISLSAWKSAHKFRSACTFILDRQMNLRSQPTTPPAQQKDDILSMLQQLGSLRDSGIITAEEFNDKKSELLARL